MLPCFIVIPIIAISAFAIDISHSVNVHDGLQSATDAAAIAGARDLIDRQKTATIDNDALCAAGLRFADGQPVTNQTPGCAIVPTWGFDNATNSGTVVVDGTKTISNLVSGWTSRNNTDNIKTHSVAEAWRSVTGVNANQVFPLAVSLDTLISHNGVSLHQA